MKELDNMTPTELEDFATAIIIQPDHTEDDIKVLSQIKYFLALHYKSINIKWSSEEARYNGCRSSKTTELSESMAVTKAEATGKAEAEKEHGTYRKINAEATGIQTVIKAIEGVIIGIQIKLKSLNNVQY